MKYSTLLLVLAGALSACSKDSASQTAQAATRPATPAVTTPAAETPVPLVDPDTTRTPVNAAPVTPAKTPELSTEMRDIDTRPSDPVGTDATIEGSDRDSQAGLSDSLTPPGLPIPTATDGAAAPKDLAAADSKPMKPKDATAPLGTVDMEFVAKAPSISAFAVEASELAVLQATTPFVREFAQLLVADHGDATREFDELLRGKGPGASKELSTEHQSRLDTLRTKQGVDFDRQYRDILVSEHKDAIALFDRAANDCEDADLKAFAAKWLTTLRAHQTKLSEMPPTSGT